MVRPSGIILTMSIGFFTVEKLEYQVETPVYQGPLDLLLQLIESAELDITKLALAQVTDQYLEHLKQLQEKTADEVSAFLVIAAKLLQIKSEALLPRPPQREPGEEDPGEQLARQLREYKTIKKAAEFLQELELRDQHTYHRLAPPTPVKVEVDLGDITIWDLKTTLEALLREQRLTENLDTVVRAPKVTIRQKIKHILHTLKHRHMTTFKELLGSKRSRVDVVVTFLAMLELIKQHIINAKQDQLFGDIEIEAAKDISEEADFDLEFTE